MVIHLRPILFGLAFVISFCGLGSIFMGWFKIDMNRGEEILTSFALGLGLTGLFTFTFGIFGIVNATLYALWTLLGLGLFIYTVLRRWYPFPFISSSFFKKPLNIFALIILIPFILQLIPPLVSPVVSTDALEYHLLIPKIFLNSGKIHYIPSLVESNYPCLVEYIYLLIMPLAGDVVCKTLHFWGGIFILFSMGGLIGKVSPKSSRFLGPALFLSMPVFVIILGWAWNDAFFIFFLLLSIGFLLNYHLASAEKRSPRILFMAGIMAGLASWMKYTIVMVLAVLIILFIIAILRWRWKWHHLFWFFLPLGLISLLVFVKNWVFTGNPFYPFLNGIFNSPYWNETAAKYFHFALQRWEIPNWNWATYFLFPFQITLRPVMVDTHPGILPLVLTPMLFFKSDNRGITFLKFFIGISVLVWLFFQLETRSLLTMFAVFFCVAAIGIEQITWSKSAYRRPLLFFLSLAILAGFGITIITNYHLTKPVDYFLGLEKQHSFLLREAKSQWTFEWLNRNPAVKKVLLVGFFGPYYLSKPHYFSSVCDPPIAEQLSNDIPNAEGLRKKLRSLNISHIAINEYQYKYDLRNGLYGWPAQQKKVFEDFIAQFCQEKAKFGKEIIYVIK